MFLRLALLACVVEACQQPDGSSGGEILFNNICLPKEWPPRIHHSHNLGGQPSQPPYLTQPPATIDISKGRQLFVDDFLIDYGASKNILITHRNPVYRDDVNPVLEPTEVWESADITKPIPSNATLNIETAFASPFSGGVFWDSNMSEYKMWYRCGAPRAGQCLATSTDGIHWIKPKYDVVEGTNIVQADEIDGSTVWLDVDEPDYKKRYKMAAVFAKNSYRQYSVLYSEDGIHWLDTNTTTGPIEDRSSIFLNPLRNPRKWIYSIKSAPNPDEDSFGRFGRSRSYWETNTLTSANWTSTEPKNGSTSPAFSWTSADRFDPPFICGSDGYTQLYNLDAVAYESVMVGFFSIFTGKYCKAGGNISAGCPLMNRTGEWDSVFIGYSRDGFHWSRPLIEGNHKVFMPMDSSPVHCVDSDNKTTCDWRWNKANVQSVGGGFIVDNRGTTESDQLLRFYVGARTGAEQLDGNATAGLAEMRRDGFASVGPSVSTESSTLVTRTVQYGQGISKLFVNLDGDDYSQVSVSVLDNATGMPVPGLVNGHVESEGVRVPVIFEAPDMITTIAQKPVRLQFNFAANSNVALYSFWFALDECGASNGWVAAGGKGFKHSTDTCGSCPC